MSHHYSCIINKSGKSGIDQTFMTQVCNAEKTHETSIQQSIVQYETCKIIYQLETKRIKGSI